MDNNTVNPLTVRDFEDILGVLEQLLDDLGSDQLAEIGGILQKGTSADQSEKTRMGIIAMRMVSRHARGTIFDVLGRAAGKDPEEFRNMGAGEALSTLEAVVQDPRNRDFFGQLQRLFSGLAKEKLAKS